MAESSSSPVLVERDKVAAGEAMRMPFNDQVLDYAGLCDRCMGNLDLVERVLDKFETRLPEDLAELERLLELEDAAKIALVAHRIKGSSSNVSAPGLRQAAADIEDLGRAGRLTEIQTHLPNLREQWHRYVDCRKSCSSPTADSAMPGPRAEFRNANGLGDAS